MKDDALQRLVSLQQANQARLQLPGSGSTFAGHKFIGLDLARLNVANANLHSVDFSRTNLIGADFRYAILEHARFVGAVLDEANLRWALLWGADLSSASLRRTTLITVNARTAKLQNAELVDGYLTHSDFSHADLTGANLTNAELSGTNFTGARLTDVQLHGAKLDNTAFANCDLSTVVGLEDCEHRGPSSIDYRTLARSGNLPAAFLRGTGHSDEWIEAQRVLLRREPEFLSAFISYSNMDRIFANRLYGDLTRKGIRCFYAPEDMKAGEKILDSLFHAIDRRDKTLLILSQYSLVSNWVEDEVTRSFAKERELNRELIIPIRLDDSVMDSKEPWAMKLRERHIEDFGGWQSDFVYNRAFARLVRVLKQEEAT